MPECLRLRQIDRSTHQLRLSFAIDDLQFSTTYWYDSVDLIALEERFGEAPMQRLYFHIAAFEINKICSLKPNVLDWGPWARFQTPAFTALWRTIFWNVWAQWRYENDLPDYAGPSFATPDVADDALPLKPTPGRADVLCFCGGGKDSLVMMKLLERAGLAYDTLSYASSIYGPADRQHRLIGALLEHAQPEVKRRQWVIDDFLDAPLLALHPEWDIQTLTAAETPSSIFGALPYAVQEGYRYLTLGHERSADTGQLIWEKTGEDVNHQWGKSTEAEALLDEYVKSQLVEGLTVFSLLKPIHDVVIFNLLRRDLDAIPDTHSCNIDKPWCLRCPKCLYVWLGYHAWLPRSVCEQTFGGENLFEVPENQQIFRELIGQADQLPFECIGQADESRLAMWMCAQKGMTGAALDLLPEIDAPAILEKYLVVDADNARIPAALSAALLDQMRQALHEAREHFTTTGRSPMR